MIALTFEIYDGDSSCCQKLRRPGVSMKSHQPSTDTPAIPTRLSLKHGLGDLRVLTVQCRVSGLGLEGVPLFFWHMEALDLHRTKPVVQYRCEPPQHPSNLVNLASHSRLDRGSLVHLSPIAITVYGETRSDGARATGWPANLLQPDTPSLLVGVTH